MPYKHCPFDIIHAQLSCVFLTIEPAHKQRFLNSCYHASVSLRPEAFRSQFVGSVCPAERENVCSGGIIIYAAPRHLSCQ